MLLIHASNLTGLGASQVAVSLIQAFLLNDEGKQIFFALPPTGKLSTINTGIHRSIIVKRWLPKPLSRILECLFPKVFFPVTEETIVLGDIPLRGLSNQVVLMHQLNLIKPHINPYSSNSINFKIMRKLFEVNLRFVKYIIVQTDVMKKQLMSSYPIAEGRIVVIPQPAPNGFHKVERNTSCIDDGLTLFYPAAGYPHKNHKVISELSQSLALCKDVKEIVVTIDDGEYKKLCFKNSKVSNVGRLSPQECMEWYSRADALFFPSVAESYGLPLVEAMVSGIPIICSNLPYARYLCGDNAIYFEPQDVKSASEAISEMKKRLRVGWQPDWREPLSKLPDNWNEVAKHFFCLLH